MGNQKKYKDQATWGFNKIQYTYLKSVCNALVDVEKIFDPLKAVLYIEKKKARPNHDEDR